MHYNSGCRFPWNGKKVITNTTIYVGDDSSLLGVLPSSLWWRFLPLDVVLLFSQVDEFNVIFGEGKSDPLIMLSISTSNGSFKVPPKSFDPPAVCS